MKSSSISSTIAPKDGIFNGVTSTSEATAEIRQQGKAFLPHVLPVAPGTTVNFPNDDPIFHNVFSLSRQARFDLGKYGKGKSPRGHRFQQPGIVPVFCDIHRHMKAFVFVVEHAHFTQADSDGGFTLTGLPPGTWRVAVWHPQLKAQPQAVTGAHLSFTLRLGR